MKKLSIIFSVFGLLLTSCSSYQYSARQTSIVRHDIQATPTVVDVQTDYNKRIEVVSDWQKTREDAMNECRYLAITQHNIDIVVDPIFKIEYRGMKMKAYKATLTGFGGYYANPRMLFEDIDALKKYSVEDIEKYLLMHNPEYLKYLNPQGETVNIFHGEGVREPARRPKTEEPRHPESVNPQHPAKSSQQTTKTVVRTTTVQSSQPTQASQPSEQVQQQSAQPQRSVEPQQTVSEEKPKTGFRKRKQ